MVDSKWLVAKEYTTAAKKSTPHFFRARNVCGCADVGGVSQVISSRASKTRSLDERDREHQIVVSCCVRRHDILFLYFKFLGHLISSLKIPRLG